MVEALWAACLKHVLQKLWSEKICECAVMDSDCSACSELRYLSFDYVVSLQLLIAVRFILLFGFLRFDVARKFNDKAHAWGNTAHKAYNLRVKLKK